MSYYYRIISLMERISSSLIVSQYSFVAGIKVLIALILGGSLYSSYATAGCAWAANSVIKDVFIANASINPTITIGVDKSSPDPTLYALTKVATSRPGQNVVTCTPGSYHIKVKADNIQSSQAAGGYPAVFSTSIPGIGIALWQGIPNNPLYVPGVGASVSSTSSGVSSNYINFSDTQATYDFSSDPGPAENTGLAFVKINNSAYANIPTNTFSFTSYISDGANDFPYRRTTVTYSLKIINGTCNIVQNSYNFPLGVHYPDEFSGVQPVGEAKQTIQLNGCTQFRGTSSFYGDDISNILTIQLNPTTATDPIYFSQGIAGLDGAGAAQGIGVQLSLGDYNNGHYTPVTFGNDINLNNYLGLGYDSENGSYSFMVKAAYVKTSGNITAGPANSHIVFIIKYN